MQYPLTLSFKIIALAPQISVTDASGSLVFYVRQKLFKLKEAVTVFGDRQQSQPLYLINADRVLDFSARYHFADTAGTALGSIKRHGMKSLWKAHYELADGPASSLTIREANPFTKVVDALLGRIPLIGLLTAYLFHPTYNVMRPDGMVVMRLKKQPSFFEAKFSVEKDVQLEAAEETRILLGLLMMVLLERSRG